MHSHLLLAASRQSDHSCRDSGKNHSLTKQPARTQLSLQIAHFRLTLGTGSGTVPFVTTFRRHILNPVDLCDPTADCLQNPALFPAS
ncbi:hypothetical protein [uncultured Duncaniella sp.]|uniref:hypothetical protein n=1 Tax=uncultured Duncaniella sp. TaxID=2768039 RepID=UPI002607ADF1|nr:hypothetical protein [uncultured Duncaniella sp.]